MKRLITVFFLAAALFALLGCGTGSKTQEQLELFNLPIGTYSGDEGNEVYSQNATDEQIGELFANRSIIKAKRAELEAMNEAGKAFAAEISNHETADISVLSEDDQKNHALLSDEMSARMEIMKEQFEVLKSEARDLNASLSSLETEIVETQYKLSFILSKNEAGAYELAEYTAVDRQDEELDVLEGIIPVSFDEKSGNISFSYNVSQRDEVFTVSFSGSVSRGNPAHLEGSFEILLGEEKQTQGHWHVILQPAAEVAEIEEPVADENLGEEAPAGTVDVDADADASGSDVEAPAENTESDVDADADASGSDVEAPAENTESDVDADADTSGSDVEAPAENIESDVDADADTSGSDVESDEDNEGEDL